MSDQKQNWMDRPLDEDISGHQIAPEKIEEKAPAEKGFLDTKASDLVPALFSEAGKAPHFVHAGPVPIPVPQKGGAWDLTPKEYGIGLVGALANAGVENQAYKYMSTPAAEAVLDNAGNSVGGAKGFGDSLMAIGRRLKDLGGKAAEKAVPAYLGAKAAGEAYDKGKKFLGIR